MENFKPGKDWPNDNKQFDSRRYRQQSPIINLRFKTKVPKNSLPATVPQLQMA